MMMRKPLPRPFKRMAAGMGVLATSSRSRRLHYAKYRFRGGNRYIEEMSVVCRKDLHVVRRTFCEIDDNAFR